MYCVCAWGRGGGYQMLSRVSMFEAVRLQLVVTVSKLPGKLILEQPDV